MDLKWVEDVKIACEYFPIIWFTELVNVLFPHSIQYNVEKVCDLGRLGDF
jgi:hypothetical protein